MKRAEEGNELVAPGCVAGELDCGFDGFGPRVAEVDFVRTAARSDGGELLGEVHHTLIVEVGPGHVDELRRLPLDGFNHARMAMASGNDRDSGREIQEAVAVDVFDNGAFTLVGNQRIAPGVGRRDY